MQQHRLARNEPGMHLVVGLRLGFGQDGKGRGARTTRPCRFPLLHVEDATLHPFLDRGGVGAASLLGLNLGQFALGFHHSQEQPLHRHGLDPGPRQRGGQLLLTHVVRDAHPRHLLRLDALRQFLLGQGQSSLDQGLDHALGMLHPQQLRALAQAQFVPDMQRIEQRHRRLVQPVLGGIFCVWVQDDLGGALELHPGRERGADHVAQRAHVVLRHPREHVALRLRNHRRIVHDRLHFFGHISGRSVLMNFPNDTRPLLVPQGHHHACPHARRHLTRSKPSVRQRLG